MGNNLSLKLFIVLCRAFRTISEIVKKDIKGYGLNLTEFEMLELLHHKGAQTIQEIGGKVLLTSGSMTYVVDQMEKKGLVRRLVCENDRRVTYVEETAQGAQLMDSIFPAHTRCIESIFSALDEQELTLMTTLLKRVAKST